jgi:hypothetical protein
MVGHSVGGLAGAVLLIGQGDDAAYSSTFRKS